MKTLPAGTYYIGDCCYVFATHPDIDWVADFCAQFWDDAGEEIKLLGLEVVAYGTAYGDGSYPSNIGYLFPVDAGLIGCTPESLWVGEGEPFGCKKITFKEPFVCSSDGEGRLNFGGVFINTTDEFEEEEYE